MIRAMASILALVLIVLTSKQIAEATDFVSPCPSVFTYEPPGTEPGKWYGVVNLTTDVTLYALWLNIVLENKADILGNWIGEVTTNNNMDFKIENTNLTIHPDQLLAVRFFIQFNKHRTPPKLKAIRFNGKEICNVDTPQEIESKTPVRVAVNDKDKRNPSETTSTTTRPTVTTTSRNSQYQYWHQTAPSQTTTKVPHWTQTTSVQPFWTEAVTVSSTQSISQPKYWKQTTTKNPYWTQTKTDDNTRTTVRPQFRPFVKDNSQYVTTTVQPTTQSWSPTTRPEDKKIMKNSSSSSLVQKVQNWSYTRVENNKQTKTQDEDKIPIHQTSFSKPTTEKSQTQYKTDTHQQTTARKTLQTQNKHEDHTTERALVWPYVKEACNLQDISKENQKNPQTEVKQGEQTKFWQKKLPDNTTGESEIMSIKIESVPYAWVDSLQKTSGDELKQVVSTQYPEQDLNRLVYLRPEDGQRESDYNPNTRPRDNFQTKPQTLVRTENMEQLSQNISKERNYSRDKEGQDIKAVKPKEENTGAIQNQPGKEMLNWPEDSQSWTGHSQNKMDYVSAYGSDETVMRFDSSEMPFQYPLTTELPPPAFYKTPDEYDMPKKDDNVDYYFGGLPLFYIPFHSRVTVERECGKVMLHNDKAYMNKPSSTWDGQWPWQIALYQQQTSVDFRYICGGTLVSRHHIITAAHCVTKKASNWVVNKNTLTVYLGKHNLRTSVEGVQVSFVSRVMVHPEYNGTSFKADLAILVLKDAAKFSDRVQPACIWPEKEVDLKYVVGLKGSVVGWGYDSTGAPKQELSLMEMPVVDQQTCILSYEDFYKRFTTNRTYCAGYKNSGSACNGDSGGGMFFMKGDSWYIRGVVSISVTRKGEYRCDPSQYVIFTDIAKFLPWIQNIVEEYF